jgi:hypothetical protein
MSTELPNISSLLLDDTIEIHPRLAKEIGLVESIICVRMMIEIRRSVTRSVVMTYPDMLGRFFPFLTLDVVKKAVLSLENRGILLSSQDFGIESRRKTYRFPEQSATR